MMQKPFSEGQPGFSASGAGVGAHPEANQMNPTSRRVQN